MMKLRIDKELLEIFKDILNRNLTLTEWRQMENCDEFQTVNYCGGFDAIEDEFCFSYFDLNKVEYWFQIPLSEIQKIDKENIPEIDIRLAK
ncbi:hypothetical protein [Tenacibaculum aiptasiae]|nr:hypothetical protein [Tenacibaculum aiptasiae]